MCDLSLIDEVEFFSWQEILMKNFVKYNVFNKDTKLYFGNCCRVCNTYMREYLVDVSFIDIMNFIENFMFKYFEENEFLSLNNKKIGELYGTI